MARDALKLRMSIRRAERTLTSLWLSAMDELPLSKTQMTQGRNSPVCGLRDVESGMGGVIGTPPRLGGPGWLVKGVVILFGCSLCSCALLGMVTAVSTPMFSGAGGVFANSGRPDNEKPKNANGMVYNDIGQKPKPLPSILKRMTLLTRASPPKHGPDLHSVGQAFPNWCEADCWEADFIWKPEEVQKDLIMAIVALVDRLASSEKWHFNVELGAQNYPNSAYSDL